MRAKEKQFESELKETVKEKIKEKKAQITSHLKKPLPAQKNKTSTQNPSYIRKDKNDYLDMRENFHLIINKASFMALRPQVKTATFKPKQTSQKPKSGSLNPKDMINSVVGKQIMQMGLFRIMGCLPNQNSISQLWVLIPDQLHDGCFYIFNVQNNLFLKAQNDKLSLASKQKSKDFLFQIIKQTDKNKDFSIYHDSVVIKSLLNNKCLNLRGILTLSQINTKNENQNFYLKKVSLYEPNKLRNSYILFNPQDKQKGKAFLSVSKDKEQICYHKIDYSLYQRWIFIPQLPFKDQSQKIGQNFSPLDKVQSQKSKNHTQETEIRSKLQSLPLAQMNIVSKAAKNLVDQYDQDCYQIINFKLEKSLTVEQNNGTLNFIFIPQNGKRQWKIQSDGFCMKIRHQKSGQYLGIQNEQIVLGKSPHYWQIFQASKNKIQANSGMSIRQYSGEKKLQVGQK